MNVIFMGLSFCTAKDTDYALIIGRNQRGFCLLFVNFILVVLWFPEVWWLMKRSVFHTNSILLLLLCISVLGLSRTEIVWLKEIFRLAQSGGELSIFCAGNARPATNGKALSTL